MAEIIVALFVFTVLVLGLGYSLLSMTRLVSDDENREVAANIASQEIDKVRAVPDAFDVYSSNTTTTIGGVVYSINRDAGWVSTSGSTANCGGGGGNLQYKAVNVSVTWPKQYVLSSPVQSATVLAPSTRINDPSYGTILVSTLGADGTGRAGVTVTVTQTSGGAAVGTVDPTDADGCSYVLKVTPGTYSVTVSKAGYIDYNQLASPSLSVTVVAGSSTTANFAYDSRASYNVKYASNFTGTGTVKLPSALTTNFLSSKGNYAVTTSSTPQYLYPLTEGYSTVAGAYNSTSSTSSGCLSVDPVTWPAGKVGSVNLKAGTRPAVGVAAGGTGSIGVPMGVIQATWPLAATSITVKGAPAPAGTGDPGCAQPTDYTFTYATPPAAGTVVYLAVPFGSYQVYGTLLGVLTLLPAGGTAAATQGEVTGTTITLDPRTP